MTPNFLENWCQTAFELSFFNPISKICKDVTEEAESKNQARDKRVIVTGTIMLMIGVVSVLSLGIGAISLAVTSKTRSELNTMKEELEKQVTMMNNLATNQKLFEEMLDTIEQQVRELQVEVARQNKILVQLQSTVPVTSFTISSIVTNLQTTLLQMRAVDRAWVKNKLDPAIFDLLNLTLPCGDNCPLTLLIP